MKKKNIPNVLTAMRAVVTLIVIALFSFEFPWKFEVIFGLFVFGSLTDFFDGYLARRWNIESKFGKVFDSLFDKVFTLVFYMMLIPYGVVPVFLLALLLFRELVVDGIKNYMLSDGVPISPMMSGKLKMWFQILMIGFILLSLIFVGMEWIFIAANVSAYIALILAYYSAFLYGKTFYQASKHGK